MSDDSMGLGSIAAGLREVVDRLHEGLQLVDRDYRYVYLNDAAIAHARKPREELVGRTMMECYPGIDSTPFFDVLRRAVASGEAIRLENEFDYPDGRRGWFELSLSPMPGGVVILSSDVTDRKELQAQLRQSQKMDAVGRLAGGVAHDFNNILTVIGSFTEFAIESLEAEHPARADLAEVARATARAAELTSKLLAVSRRKPARPETLDVNGLVGEMHRMLARVVQERIEVRLRLTQEGMFADVDPGGLEQVLMNLVVNARDAMPGGGILTIETCETRIDEEIRMRWGRPIPAGDYAVIAVSDTGTGIQPENLERVFEPFFTTKPVGEGTGLGLSVCWGIVEQAGGYVGIYSEPGSGTTFRVYLPRAAHRAERAPSADRSLLPRGHEIIAVVEDDERIRELMVRSLRKVGYEVVEVVNPNGVDAAATLSTAHLLVTDIVMPGLTGPALVARLRATHPKLRVLYVSGYTNNAALHRQFISDGEPLLEKPFTPDALARAVRAALE